MVIGYLQPEVKLVVGFVASRSLVPHHLVHKRLLGLVGTYTAILPIRKSVALARVEC